MQENFIRGIKLDDEAPADSRVYPYTIPAIRDIETVTFTAPVTFFVGENGTGKSTLIEAIAVASGFNAEGGTKNYNFTSQDTTSPLASAITLVRGARREKAGYFLRAESFYTTANYADSGTFPSTTSEVSAPILFDGKRIHEQSHGEAFMAIVSELRPGLFIFDEPESALSPRRQIALIHAMQDLVAEGSQFIVATHSPIVLAFPGATIYQLSGRGVWQVDYDTVDHVRLTKSFLHNPDRYLT